MQYFVQLLYYRFCLSDVLRFEILPFKKDIQSRLLETVAILMKKWVAYTIFSELCNTFYDFLLRRKSSSVWPSPKFVWKKNAIVPLKHFGCVVLHSLATIPLCVLIATKYRNERVREGVKMIFGSKRQDGWWNHSPHHSKPNNDSLAPF